MMMALCPLRGSDCHPECQFYDRRMLDAQEAGGCKIRRTCELLIQVMTAPPNPHDKQPLPERRKGASKHG